MIGQTVRPRREPLYSKGNREDFPIPPEYEKVEYMDFIGSHVENTNYILVSQSLCQNYFSGIFASQNQGPRRSTSISWWKTSNCDALFNYIQQKGEQGEYVYSLVADDTTGIFGVFLIEGYGIGQSLITYNPSKDTCFDNIADILQKWQVVQHYKGRAVTCCTSKASTYYIVMTDNVIGYHGERQVYFTYRDWSDVEIEIKFNHNYGYNITSLCYNQELQEYLVVMTTSPARQPS